MMTNKRPKTHGWQEALANLITDPAELFALLSLNQETLNEAYQAILAFPLKIPRSLLNRIEKGNINDPVLAQFLPGPSELITTPGYDENPLQELAVAEVPGLLHKYYGRVLVTLTGTCAVHCRFCFRKYFPYHENNPGRKGWEKIYAYLRDHASIAEVILSGGDPLAVSDQLLTQFTHGLDDIKTIKRIRIHTRIPVILPERITDDFLYWVKHLKQDLVIVVHVNHPNEINQEVSGALQTLSALGVTLLNQSVLLKNINNDIEVLAALSEKLFAIKVLPYYLHVLDKVKGTAHFDMPREDAQLLHQALATRLPGYLVPKLVREDPFALNKTDLFTTGYVSDY